MQNHDISGDLHITACLLDLSPCSKQLFKNLDLTGRAGAKTCCKLGSISPSQVSWLQRKEYKCVCSLTPSSCTWTQADTVSFARECIRWQVEAALVLSQKITRKSINLNFQSSVSFPACAEEHSGFGKDRLIKKRSKAFATLISICRNGVAQLTNVHCLEMLCLPKIEQLKYALFISTS